MCTRALVISAIFLMLVAPATAQQYPARLAGHAILPAQSFVDPPDDASSDLKVSGKFTTATRVETIGTIEGTSGNRPTGLKLPFRGQPLQGHSGIKRLGNGEYWVLTDNGFGSKVNSPDAMLYLNRHFIDFARGAVERKETVFLHDADRRVPFRIANEGSDKRYLTGSDFDVESFQIVGDKFWIADEFGPFLIRTDNTGKVEAVFETLVDGRPARSPDHPAVVVAPVPTGTAAFNVRRSKGFEGMAASPDGRFLYAMLEGPIWNAEKKEWEKAADGKEYLRILEFDVRAERWTDRHWQYVLDSNGHAIGDFNMVDGATALVIERDNGEGTADKACPPAQQRPDCFHDIAKFKRVYKIELSEQNVMQPVRKIGYIDLMQIADPDKKAKKPLNDTVLTFPFFTIENVDVVDERHIIVGNDNNLPYSSSREPNKADDNEFVLLEVGEFLRAR